MPPNRRPTPAIPSVLDFLLRPWWLPILLFWALVQRLQDLIMVGAGHHSCVAHSNKAAVKAASNAATSPHTITMLRLCARRLTLARK